MNVIKSFSCFDHSGNRYYRRLGRRSFGLHPSAEYFQYFLKREYFSPFVNRLTILVWKPWTWRDIWADCSWLSPSVRSSILSLNCANRKILIFQSNIHSCSEYAKWNPIGRAILAIERSPEMKLLQKRGAVNRTLWQIGYECQYCNNAKHARSLRRIVRSYRYAIILKKY